MDFIIHILYIWALLGIIPFVLMLTLLVASDDGDDS